MNIKHSIIALGAAGATAALVFGGSAVSTAFTSNHDGSFASKSATIADSYQNWDLGLDNAIPGDTVGKTMTYTNSGSVPMRLAITVGQPVTEGADANVSALENATKVSILGYNVTLSDIAGAKGQSFELPTTVRPGGSFQVPATMTLSNDADNTASGASATVPFKLTATATH